MTVCPVLTYRLYFHQMKDPYSFWIFKEKEDDCIFEKKKEKFIQICFLKLPEKILSFEVHKSTIPIKNYFHEKFILYLCDSFFMELQ